MDTELDASGRNGVIVLEEMVLRRAVFIAFGLQLGLGFLKSSIDGLNIYA